MITRRSLVSFAALSAGPLLTTPGSLLAEARPETKPDLRVLTSRPLNAETPAHLLDEPCTSARHMFVRNNGLPPAPGDPALWRLTVDGEACQRPLRLSLAELRAQFATHTYALTIECGGNGRAEFHPPAPGNQWTTGAVSCARWTGVRLSDLLAAAGMTDAAIYVAFYGRDRHLSGDPNRVVISRGVPTAKALQPETLVAWALNDAPIPLLHGGPLRLVAGGWPGSVSGKWLHRLAIRDRVHDGPKMGGYSYRTPCKPVAPGAEVAHEDMCIIESMPVKSLITCPASGVRHRLANPLAVRGHAWAGERAVARMFLSADYGQTWQRAALDPPVNRLAWQRFRGEVRFARPGYYEIWARAEDDHGVAQPMLVPGWNPKGYLNNACHRIAVQVA